MVRSRPSDTLTNVVECWPAGRSPEYTRASEPPQPRTRLVEREPLHAHLAHVGQRYEALAVDRQRERELVVAPQRERQLVAGTERVLGIDRA